MTVCVLVTHRLLLLRLLWQPCLWARSPLCRQLVPVSHPQRPLQATCSHFSSAQWLNLTLFFFFPSPRWRCAWTSSRVWQLATPICTSRPLMPTAPPSATWSCILHPVVFLFCCLGCCAGSSGLNSLLDSLPSQQQSCLLISHVIEALILDPQAARWASSKQLCFRVLKVTVLKSILSWKKRLQGLNT